jgi:hypothetical protein
MTAGCLSEGVIFLLEMEKVHFDYTASGLYHAGDLKGDIVASESPLQVMRLAEEKDTCSGTDRGVILEETATQSAIIMDGAVMSFKMQQDDVSAKPTSSTPVCILTRSTWIIFAW